MIAIIHGGQTGVDRGGHDAAITCGWKISGFMPQNGRDERGLIPRDVAQFLEACLKKGYPARTIHNIELCDALLLVVQNRDDPRATPGSSLTWNEATLQAKYRWVTDDGEDPVVIARWLHPKLQIHYRSSDAPFRLMVAGPRESKWLQGQAVTERVLRHVAAHLEKLHNKAVAQ